MQAFGEIDIDPALVQELVRLKQAEQLGYRVLIQNGLYSHIQSVTGAPFYSPFFIKSPDAHRSYWFIHLSKHREARNEIGMIHWAENNTTIHHGGAGLHALGFTPGRNFDQMTMDYVFDDHAKTLSRAELKQQLPRLIYQAADSDVAPSLEDLFGIRCNDTPVVRECELDDVPGTSALASDVLADPRTGRNGRHALAGLFRQSVFGRLAGYEDVNDADRLRHDLAMRWIVGAKATSGAAASPSQIGRFETQWLAADKNLLALADLSGQWIDRVHARRPPRGIVLDMDSSVSPTHGEQENSVWNGHYACTCYHPLFGSTSSVTWNYVRFVPATSTAPTDGKVC
jgi:Transposase DDE domain group 1